MKNELFIMEMVDNPFAVKLFLHFLVNEVNLKQRSESYFI